MSSKSPSDRQTKKFRHDVARLKAKGLLSKTIDARSAKPTRHLKREVEKYRDVLEGRAQAAKAPSKAVAKEFASTYRVKNGRVVVPVQKGERVRIGKKSREITGSFTSTSGEKVYTQHSKKPVNAISDLPSGPGITYAIPIGAALHREESLEDMATFMFPYEQGPRPYLNWQKYIIVERRAPRHLIGETEDLDY